MVSTRGAYRFRPRVRFSTPEMEEPGISAAAGAHSPDLHADTQPALAPAAIPEEPQGFKRYQTRMGPQAPSLMPQRRLRRARLEPSPPPADEGSSPQLSPASRIRRPMFNGDPISRNVDLRARDFHGEPFYYVQALTTDPRSRASMSVITQYSLLPFMTPRQFYYPWVVLQFYHSMTSRGLPSPLELRFSIDGRQGVL